MTRLACFRIPLVVGLAIAALAGSATLAGAGTGGQTGAAATPVYATDFADPGVAATEWQFKPGETTETGKGYSLALTPGQFIVSLDGKRLTNLWLSPDMATPPVDQVVETSFAAIEGGRSVYAGVVCQGRLGSGKNDDLGYGFVVANDGYYTIGAYAGKGFRRLVNPKGKLTTDALDPSGPNTLRAECVTEGPRRVRVTMFVNDQRVASAVDRRAVAKPATGAYLLTEADGGKPGQVTYTSFRVSPA